MTSCLSTVTVVICNCDSNMSSCRIILTVTSTFCRLLERQIDTSFPDDKLNLGYDAFFVVLLASLDVINLIELLQGQVFTKHFVSFCFVIISNSQFS